MAAMSFSPAELRGAFRDGRKRGEREGRDGEKKERDKTKTDGNKHPK